MKNNINKFLEIYKVPRYKALIQLGLYGIFFIFVFILINFNSSPKTIISNLSALEKLEIMDNYEYSYYINYNNNNYVIEGIRNNDKETFIFNNLTFILEDNNLLLNNEIIDNPIEIDYQKFYPNNLSLLIAMGSLEAKVENYKTKEITKQYIINVSNFINYYYGYEIFLETDKNITVETTEFDNTISKIKIDLSNLNLFNEYKIGLTSLEINYLNNK